jgi:hypothetical protein
MLLRYSDRFSLEGENIERTDAVQHGIDTGDNEPFRERLRTYSPEVEKILEKEREKMSEQGVIQPSSSAYASNLLLVRKPDVTAKDGMKNRACAAFVQLNRQTKKELSTAEHTIYI